MYERILRTDVIGHYDDPIKFDDWMRPHRERAIQQAIDTEAALAVPINENSNETNGPQDYENLTVNWFGEMKMTGYCLRQFWV
jgi:hypothetical protein